jgi:small nuclear ribonucleoprotein (snRNP)-like protein
MMNIINYRLRITLADSRVLTGQMLAFDKHMNLVLADCEEFRKVKSKGKVPEGQPEQEEKRMLGLVILRGETIVSMSIDGPPPPSTEDKSSRASQLMTGPGVGRVSAITIQSEMIRCIGTKTIFRSLLVEECLQCPQWVQDWVAQSVELVALLLV